MSFYTLYIDESGDFESQKGEWLIGGYLISARKDEADQALQHALSPLVKELGLKRITDFHLTELRRKLGRDKAIQDAETLFGTIGKLGYSSHFLTIVNEEKIKFGDTEHNYRVMLSGMISMLDDVIQDLDELKSLDVVIATRTKDGVRMTTENDIQNQVVNKQGKFLDADLTSGVLLQLLRRNSLNFSLDCATRNWGLVIADFLCNLTYHRNAQCESELLLKLTQKNLLTSFEAFGNFNERRARVADKNKDYPLSIIRWLEIFASTDDLERKNRAVDAIEKLLMKLTLTSGTDGVRFAVEGIAEKVWRANFRTPEMKVTMLTQLVLALDNSSELPIRLKSYLTFKIRNLLLLQATRTFNNELAITTARKQNSVLPELMGDPDTLMLALTFKRLETEIYVNLRDFKHATALAQQYENLLLQYESIWELFDFPSSSLKFKDSDFWFKSECLLLRLYVLDKRNNVTERIETLLKLALQRKEKNPRLNELSRVRNLKIQDLLNHKQYREALSFAQISLDRIGLYDTFYTIHCLNFNAGLILPDKACQLLLEIEKNLTNNQKTTYPIAETFAELGLAYYLFKGDKGTSLRYLGKAKKVIKILDIPPSKQLIDYLSALEKGMKENKKADYYLNFRERLLA